jgi:hypothetical protein
LIYSSGWTGKSGVLAGALERTAFFSSDGTEPVASGALGPAATAGASCLLASCGASEGLGFGSGVLGREATFFSG